MSKPFVTFAEMSEMEQLPPIPRSQLPLTHSDAVEPHSFPPSVPEEALYSNTPREFREYDPMDRPRPSIYDYKFDPIAFYRQPFLNRVQLPILIAILYFILQTNFISVQHFQWMGLDKLLYQETTGLPTATMHILKSVSMGALFYFMHFICFLSADLD
jgi:hypothetical protein